MNNLTNRFAAVSLLSLVLGSLSAQTLNVNPNTNVTVGTNLQISYMNPGMAGRTIVVTVTHSFPPQAKDLAIVLNSSGEGATNFTVPQVSSLFINAPKVAEQVILVN
jgi:hypothetical protein